jgi:hypothetical protein
VRRPDFASSQLRSADASGAGVRLGTGERPRRRTEDGESEDERPSRFGSSRLMLEKDMRPPEPAFIRKANALAFWSSTPVRILLGLLALLGLIAALLQAAYWFRQDIALEYPMARPVIKQLCDQVGVPLGVPNCHVDFVERVQNVVIESSAMTPSGSGAVEIQAVLKNSLRMPNRWPHLEVTLTDTRDVVTARRVIEAKDYLRDPKQQDKSMRAFGEYSVRLMIDAKDIDAAGFRLAVFYP